MMTFERGWNGETDAPPVLAALSRDGVGVLRSFVPPELVARVRDEALALGASADPWVAHLESPSGFFVAITPLAVSKLGQHGRIANIARVFSHPLLRTLTRGYLGAGWYPDRIIVDRKDASPEPLTGWHADQFERRGKCVKFMLYLNDIDAARGAFSYVPGSHRVIDLLVAHAVREGLNNGDVHTFEEITAMAERSLAADGDRTVAARTVLEDAAHHIRSSAESDDHYSIAAPAGSVVVFDANGIHRGSVVRQDERFVVRCHCRGFDPVQVLSSRTALKTLLARTYLRWMARTGGAPSLL